MNAGCNIRRLVETLSDKKDSKDTDMANACIGVESENRAGNIRHNFICACGEIGIRVIFRVSCRSGVQVRVLSGAPSFISEVKYG